VWLWLWRFRHDLRAATTAAAAARTACAARAAGTIRIAATTSTGGVSNGVTRALLRCSALVVLELALVEDNKPACGTNLAYPSTSPRTRARATPEANRKSKFRRKFGRANLGPNLVNKFGLVWGRGSKRTGQKLRGYI
jgi:hypothetical protein